MSLRKVLEQRQLTKVFNAKTRIVTHRDWDGVVSAALWRAFIQKRFNKQIPLKQVYFSIPKMLEEKKLVKYFDERRKKTFIQPLRGKGFILLDLPFVPGVEIWIDHHGANLPLRQQLRRVPAYFYDPFSPSTCQLVAQLLRSEYNFQIPHELVLFTNRLDFGTHGKKYQLENLERASTLHKLSYITEGLTTDPWTPLMYHIMDLVTVNYDQIEKIEDMKVEEAFQEVKGRITIGREIIKHAEYFKGLLIIDSHEVKDPHMICYWDIIPIFYQEISPKLHLPLLGCLIVRNGYNCRLAIPWIHDPRLVKLKKAKRLNIRPIAREFNGEGHYTVAGFTLQNIGQLNRVRSLWTAMIQDWGFNPNDLHC